MHYANGREAKVGDPIVCLDGDGTYGPNSGRLVAATAGADTCNGLMVPAGSPTFSVTIGRCLHLDDVKTIGQPPAQAI